jgi:apolipoprotein N-acyltransferase
MNLFFNTLTVKTRCFSAFALGVMLVFTLPPFFAFPFVFVCFMGLYLLLQLCETSKQAFWLAWSYGFGFFLVGVYWIIHSLLVDAAMFWWLIPFALCLIPAISALFIAVVGWFSFKIRHKFSPPAHVILFAVAWVLMELLRGYVTQFPWNYVGYIWLGEEKSLVAQMAAFFGVSGLSLMLVLFSTFPAILFERKDGNFVHVDKFKEVSFAWSAVLWMTVYGVLTCSDPIEVADDAPLVRLVQPNIPQKMKHDQTKQFEILHSHLKYTAVPSQAESGLNPDIVVWPEAPVNYSIEHDAKMRELITRAMPPNSYLLTGGMRVEDIQWSARMWNSFFALNSAGEVVSSYDKHILVPFGEYIPFKEYFPFVQKITQGAIGFARGDGPQTIKLPDVPAFSPLICYEAVFPGQIVDDENRPRFLLNVTNDAWFGNSFGPHQHLHMARMRAIEEGIPLVRVANTGISAVIDQRGTIVQALGLNQAGVMDVLVPLPKAGAQVTWYQRYRSLTIALIMVLLTLGASRWGRVKL